MGFNMRKTKIVCTIGPASETEQIITGLCKAGMNVARLNFSHNTHEDHQKRIDLIKKVRSELKMPIDIYFTAVGIIYIPTEEELIAAMEELRDKPLKSA